VKPVPLSIQTLYADLVQQLESVRDVPASVNQVTRQGRSYWQGKYRVGKVQRVFHIGATGDVAVDARVNLIRDEMGLAKGRRTIVAALRRTLGGPTQELGQVLDVLADAGLFRTKDDGSLGSVLVGTAAFQCYSGLLGYQISGTALMTSDADLATAHLALAADDRAKDCDQAEREEPSDLRRPPGRPAWPLTMETILRRADPTFSGLLQLSSRGPSSMFRSRQGFMVDILTPMRSRNDTNPMPLPALQAGAVPLQYLDWLIQGAVPAGVLWGAGVLVTVPDPVRFCIHKMILASVRMSEKRGKDLKQAKVLYQILTEREPDRLEDLLDDARSQGEQWRKAIGASLKQIAGGAGKSRP
jgi:hypothetical protein